jgi:hypothetical protein
MLVRVQHELCGFLNFSSTFVFFWIKKINIGDFFFLKLSRTENCKEGGITGFYTHIDRIYSNSMDYLCVFGLLAQNCPITPAIVKK